MSKKSKFKNNIVGYIHTKSNDKTAALQEEALRSVGCKKIYNDHSSDIDFERPELVNAVKHVQKKKSGCIVVYSLEQLAENLENLSDICKVLVNLKLRLISIQDDIIIIPYPNVINFVKPLTLKIGYVHTYQSDSSDKLQKSVLSSEGCQKIYSGYSEVADFERPELVKAVKYLQKKQDNIIVINSFERLASSLENLCDICKVLKTLSIPLRSIDENIFIRKYSAGENDTGDLDGIQKNTKENFNQEDASKEKISRKISKKTIIKFIVLLIILGGVYYWLLTRFNDNEMSESQYELMQKKSGRVYDTQKRVDDGNLLNEGGRGYDKK